MQRHVHRLVAKAFIKNSDPRAKTIVDHINGIKTDNQVVNLRWVTPGENANHIVTPAKRIGNRGRPVVRLTLEGIFTGSVYETAVAAAKETGATRASIAKCCQGGKKTTGGWRWMYEDEYRKSVGLLKDDPDELWTTVIAKGKEYTISSKGRIRGGRDAVARLGILSNGYYRTTKDGGGIAVHILVAMAFPETCPKPADVDNLLVNHKDGDPTNNAASNLEWVTPSENILHARRVGPKKLPDRPVRRIKRGGETIEYASAAEAAYLITGSRASGLSSHIHMVCRGETCTALGSRWEYVPVHDHIPDDDPIWAELGL